MATPTPIPHCVKVELRHICDGQSVYNTFYAQCEAEPTIPELEDMCSGAEDAWVANWQAKLTSDISLFEITATSLTGLDAGRVVRSVDPPQQGTKDDQPLPLNATVAIKRSTGHRGRGRNGRIFWPHLSKNQVDGDTVVGTDLSGLVTAAQAMGTGIAAAGPAGTTDVVAHQFGTHAGTSDVVLSYVAADNYVDTQKDRLPRHKAKRKARISVP